MSNMTRAISKNGGVTIVALDSTEIVRAMEEIHQTSAVVSAGLGRLLTAASLMGSWQKNPADSMTLRVDGGGPAGILLAVSDGDGNVRGYATNPVVEIPLRADGKLDVGGAVGKAGTFSVVRDIGLKEPYIGQTPLASGEIGEDVTAYYMASEQTPTACGLGVLVNPDLTIRKAGGYLLQLMPGADEALIAKIEENVAAMPSVTALLDAAGGPEDIIAMALDGLEPQVLERRTVAYKCHCSREKTADILASLGLDELREMREDGPTAQVECHFCNRKYVFELDELMENIAAQNKG